MIFPITAILLLSLIVIQNWSLLTRNQDSVVYTYLRSFSTGVVGSGYGAAAGGYIPFSSLQPGDILLGGWSNCAYGKYAHAALYLGQGQVIEAFVDSGVCIQSLEHFTDYTYLCFIRVNASEKIKAKVVAAARQLAGATFYPVSFKQNDRFYNCTDVIWQAYQQQGVNLDPNHDFWVSPDSFRASPDVRIIFEKGM